ncbi:MAG: sulfite exporter TauE/SafE family protein [Pseudomonadota bacterium]
MLDQLASHLTLWTPATALAVAGAALLAGFIRGFLGFGGAMIIIMVLNVTLGPLMAVAVACLSGLPATVQLLPTAVRHSERGFVVPFATASILAAPLGTWLLVSVDPAVMKVAIAATVLVMLALLLRGMRIAVALGPRALFGAGFATGLVQGLTGMGGPPAVTIALARDGTPERQRANVIGAVTALALCAIVPLAWHGLFTLDAVIAAIAVVPLYSGATWWGARYFSAGGSAHYRRAALLALGVVGLVTFSMALRDVYGF